MLDILTGGLLGGLLRLAPEVIKLFTAKADRNHEYRMANLSFEQTKYLASQKLEEINAQGQNVLDATGLEALIAAVKGQSQLTGFWLIDFISATVRPALTYWWMALYTAYKVSVLWLAAEGTSWATAISMAWGPEDTTILAGIINFWFLDRVIKKRTHI